VAISNIVGNEVFYCEKGFGAYVSSRRLRVSKKSGNEKSAAVIEDLNFAQSEKSKNLSLRNYGCKTLEIAYLASSRLDAVILKDSKDNELIKPFMLLVREAGGKVVESDNLILASNGLINLV
jgi:fructose-1,6-bisphosphatase/inositol monophosphatase family enzyme